MSSTTSREARGSPVPDKRVVSQYTIYCGLKDPYSVYGLKHFLTKYGLSTVDSPASADIGIGYSFPEDSLVQNQVILDRHAEDQACTLVLSQETTPLFLRPAETQGDKQLARAVVGNREYNCISISDNRVRVGFDIFREIGKILAGYYEEHFLKQSESGLQLRSIPVVDVLEDTMAATLNQLLPQPLSRFTWPDDHKFALVLSHDVDRVYKTYQYLPSMLNSIKKADPGELFYHIKNMLFKHGTRNPYWTFETIAELEKDLGVKSTYYFLNEKGKLNPLSLKSWILYRGVYDIQSPVISSAIKILGRNGCEIGVHGSYNSYNTHSLMQGEKETLESITGCSIKGVRQHYLNYDGQVTPVLHCQTGFKYDTTLGFKPKIGIGFRRGTSFPFPVMLPDLQVSELWEIPLIIMDGALDSAVSLADCLQVIDKVQKYGGVLTILWHTNRLNKREYPEMVDYYIKIVTEAMSRGAWAATAGEVYDWLQAKLTNMKANEVQVNGFRNL